MTENVKVTASDIISAIRKFKKTSKEVKNNMGGVIGFVCMEIFFLFLLTEVFGDFCYVQYTFYVLFAGGVLGVAAMVFQGINEQISLSFIRKIRKYYYSEPLVLLINAKNAREGVRARDVFISVCSPYSGPIFVLFFLFAVNAFALYGWLVASVDFFMAFWWSFGIAAVFTVLWELYTYPYMKLNKSEKQSELPAS